VAIAISRQSAMHELLREAGGFAVSILAAGQEWLAQHFARGVPPIAMWHGIAVEAGASGAPFLTGALGWLECSLSDQLPVGTHTLFVGEVLHVELGEDAPPLLRSRGEYTS
jgi:flavin reductase (DIM6/NTAB) family NADH-FMN oxidoreductase RutF